MASRHVTGTRGAWNVVHPFTGRIEFATSERLLAEAVAAEFDSNDPLNEKWLFDALYALPPQARQRAEWVMSSETMHEVHKLRGPDGFALLIPSASVRPGTPDALLGLPIAIDEDAAGITLRDRSYQTDCRTS